MIEKGKGYNIIVDGVREPRERINRVGNIKSQSSMHPDLR